MENLPNGFIDAARCPLGDAQFRARSKRILDEQGVLVLPQFLTQEAVASIRRDGEQHQHLAFYTASRHNIYLKPFDPQFPAGHPRNREVASSKGCITTDQVPQGSALHRLYDAPAFRDFLCTVLDVRALFPYADSLSSVNLHFASEGQQLGWHYDNSSFAVTLMVQSAERGGVFEYVKGVRDADKGEANYPLSANILDGTVPVQTLTMNAGTLVLFRGRNSMHRVTPVQGNTTRMLAVLAYNTEPGVALSESARMTFYGRLGTVGADGPAQGRAELR
ncbi:MAG: 2OG-Fe(II) oxygenase [Rhodoferax sp.]|nr:2OG-Fe(II) oxygenase [Rhodoferax sp.]